ncbi:ABC transporter ATP-binding protein [Candidatus Daviesbacteria bacterium]|nr:ABC transporter ATP-binding protein [Candidatus Daviesbacteria bacterium]
MLRLKRRKKMSFLKKVWLLMRPFHKDLFGILVVTALFETVRMGGPFLFGKILDLLIQTKGLITLETALVIVGGLAGVRIVSLVIDHITDWIILTTLFKSDRYISTVAYEKMVELSLDYHEKISTGKKISLINRGTDKLVELIEGYTFEFQPVVIQLLVTSIIIFLTNWRVGLIFSLSLFPFILITFYIFESTRKMREKRHDAYEVSSGEVGDTMTNITVVKGFAQEQRENQAFSSIRDLIKQLLDEEFKKRMFRGFSRNILIEIFYIVILVVGLFEIKASALTIGGLVFLINLVERAYSNIYRLGRIYQRISDAKEPVDRLTELMQARPSVQNTGEAIVYKEIKGQISFKHVSFAYNQRRVLKNVSLTIPEGSFVALVGKSGSGKSTIAKLLSRYYDPSSGQIVIDGKYDLRQLDLDVYRKQTAVVFQDSPVPNRKIWDVISYAGGKKSFSSVKDQVIEAARLAHAHDFILELPEGYQTEIGERGVKLSGGQRQRLAIARALFAQPKILIMDEPTSHLDALSEAQIQKALEDISKQRSMTKIVIAHRLSTVQKADQIFVMERGRVVEKGSHQRLLKLNGVYAQIVKQSELKS